MLTAFEEERFIVIVWIGHPRDQRQIRFRSVLLTRLQRDSIYTATLHEEGCKLNEQVSGFGAVPTNSALGVTIEYRLAFRRGILGQTIISVAEGIALAAQYVKDSILAFLDGPAD